MRKDSDDSRIRRIKRALVRKGWGLRLSPTKNRRAPDWGKYHIVELETFEVVHGKAFNLTLDEIETFVFGE
jgi:hypothetical protein